MWIGRWSAYCSCLLTPYSRLLTPVPAFCSCSCLLPQVRIQELLQAGDISESGRVPRTLVCLSLYLFVCLHACLAVCLSVVRVYFSDYPTQECELTEDLCDSCVPGDVVRVTAVVKVRVH